MRIQIFARDRLPLRQPVRGVIQTLRLTPRNHDGQYVVNWRIDMSENCQLDQHEDAFGNVTHVFNVEGPIEDLRVLVEGEVETHDTNGVVRGTVERFPPSLYLRETPLTHIDDAIAALAHTTQEAAGDDPLTFLHAMMARLHEAMTYDRKATTTATTAAEALALKRGVCQDFAHIFIAAARSRGIPARYVSGHFRQADDPGGHERAHAWAEAYLPVLGWVGFDPANKLCPTDAHVRVAVGLDYLGAAPVRGSRHGGGGETMAVSVNVDAVASQSQA